jgi:peptidoglycan/LPS O-acetylase OafA/YrhL
MSILPVIKAPLAVQLYRIAFAVCVIYFGSLVWRERRIGSFVGLLELQTFTFFSLLGLIYTCIRARRSRWILAVLGILIPAVILAAMLWVVFSHPAWWEWPFLVLMFFTVPVTLAVSLFRDKKTSEYFMTSAV